MRRQSRSLNKLKSHKCFQPRLIEFGQMVWEKVEPDVNNDNAGQILIKKNSSGNLILVKSDTCTERAWAILVINLQHVEIHKAILCQDTKNILIHITWTLPEEVGI